MGGLVSILKSAVSYNFCTGAPISLHLLLLGAFLAQSLNRLNGPLFEALSRTPPPGPGADTRTRASTTPPR